MPNKKNEIPEPVSVETVPSLEPDAAEPVPEPVTRPQRRTVSEDILQLNDEEIGITSEDSEDAKWGYLAGAARRQQILTGVVSHVVRSETGNHACAIDIEGMRVLIPIREMVLTEWPEDEPVPKAVWQHMQHIRHRITELRMQRNISECQMSLELGQSKSYVQSITSGRSLPSIQSSGTISLQRFPFQITNNLSSSTSRCTSGQRFDEAITLLCTVTPSSNRSSHR